MSLLISSCRDQNKKDRKEIKDCFAGYKASILESNGEEAIKWIDKNTLDYYDRILEVSITGDSATVQNLGLMDKLTVLTVRHRIPQEEVLKMDGNSFFIYAIDAGMVGKNSIMPLEIGDIDISGNFAKGQLIANGQEAPLFFHFNKEGDKWKINITSIFVPSTAGLKQAIKNNGQTENQFIFEMLEILTGKVVENSVWQPLR
jgi:hypothetical protein